MTNSKKDSKNDYQQTLNLPKTDFSMRAGLAQKEPTLLKEWEDKGVYKKIRAKSKDKPTYTLHDGPPYANGNIHMGHALNKVLKDIIVKMKTMQGHDSLYVPGWDCHGLPIEHQLFKKLKKRKSDVDTVEFRKKAAEFALSFVDIQKEEFKRLGIFGEWDNPYLTLAPEYEYWILKSFARLYKDNYIYRGLKPVNWCSTCETALAEAEVEYEDHTSPSVYVKFKVKNADKLKGVSVDKDLYLLIWTTTPWTLLANVAVSAHPTYEYVLVDVDDTVLIIEKSLSVSVLAKAGVENARVLATVSGEDLKVLVYEHPFGIKDECTVINVDYVTREDGTGLVHTAPGHGQEDYEAGLANGLDILMPVNDRGVFTEEAGAFAGQYVFKANENIIEDLRSRKVLFAAEDFSHSYPHCWRCKKPIVFRATKQWFLKVDHKNLRGELKKVIKQDVQWIPSAGEERILGMVVGRPDWCLSRQRHWGVPIPALECNGCGDEHKLFAEVIEKFAEIAKTEGSDAWFERDISDFIPEGFTCPDCGKSEFKRTQDILDVWFDSGVSNQAVIGPMLQQEIPADLYLEGSDQHRGWFQSSLIPSVAMHGKPPFKAVLTHGFVVDGDGRKMSKSMGNVMAPQEIIKNNGVDILRLWVAASNYHDDIRLSKEIVDRDIDAYRKIRNTVRFLLGNLDGFNPDKDQVVYNDLTSIDKWALYRLWSVTNAVKDAYNKYEFSRVYKEIYSFCNEELSGIYLDILKDRLYTSATSSQKRRAAQTVLFHILNHLVRLLAPILCFTAEEIFQCMPKEAGTKGFDSVHLLEWLDAPDEWEDNGKPEEELKLLVEIRPYVLKALEDKRREGVIGSPLAAKVIFETSSSRDFDYLNKWEGFLPEAFIVSQVEIKQVDNVKDGVSESFSQTRIIVEKADGEKCSRCWNFKTLGEDPKHPGLCSRCSEIVTEM